MARRLLRAAALFGIYAVARQLRRVAALG